MAGPDSELIHLLRTLQDAVEEGGGGGGGPSVGLISLGLVNAVDLLERDVTLYTPAAGELVLAVGVGDAVIPDTSIMYVYSGSGMVAAVQAESVPTDSIASRPAKKLMLTSAPLIASLHASPGHLTSEWLPEHEYGGSEVLVKSGHLWVNNGGTSGTDEPDWESGIGSDVEDGDFSWQDDAAVPTTGSAYFYAIVATPVTPTGTNPVGLPVYQYLDIDVADFTPGVPQVVLAAPSNGELLTIQAQALNVVAPGGDGGSWLGFYCEGDETDYARGYLDHNGWNGPNITTSLVLPVKAIIHEGDPLVTSGSVRMVVMRVTPGALVLGLEEEKEVEVRLTSAELGTIDTVRVLAIGAPGAGFYTQLRQVEVWFFPGETLYTAEGGGNEMRFQWGEGAEWYGYGSNPSVLADVMEYSNLLLDDFHGYHSGDDPGENQPLYLGHSAGAFVDGDGIWMTRIRYATKTWPAP